MINQWLEIATDLMSMIGMDDEETIKTAYTPKKAVTRRCPTNATEGTGQNGKKGERKSRSDE